MEKMKGYINGKLFITSDNLNLIKYSLEQEIKNNGAKTANIYIPKILNCSMEYKNGNWENEN